LAFTAQEVAEHVTLVTHAAFCRIGSRELLDKNLEHGPAHAPCFELLKKVNERTMWVLMSEILRHEALKERARVVSLLVRVAESCLQMNNYDSAMVVVSLLEQAPIHRLKKTWHEVDQMIPLHWRAVVRAVGTRGGNSLVGTMQRLIADPPFMPFGGWIMNELMKLNVAADFLVKDEVVEKKPAPPPPPPPIAPTAVRSGAAQDSTPLPPPPPPPPPPALVNFDRMRKIAVIVDAARCSQRTNYPFTELNPALLKLLLAEPLYPDDDAAYDRSLKLEARADKKRR
jgi:hypothetical protein